MTWCSHFVGAVFVSGLILITLRETASSMATSSDNQECERALLEAESQFYNGSAYVLTKAEKLGIWHDGRCYKRCKYIARHVGERCHGNVRGCPDSPATHSRQRRASLDSGCNVMPPMCNENTYFRTIDGSCNNKDHPEWGMGNRIQNRILPNVYQDGKGVPRSQGCNGELPSARLVSNIVHAVGETTDVDKKRSVFIMLFGQFLAHDISQTPMSKRLNGDDLECCDLPDKDSDECHPISIPDDDPRFKPSKCMSFPRSVGRLDCNDVRQQVNKHSAYLDLSMTYGTNDEQSKDLRQDTGGKLNSIGDSLDMDPASDLCELAVPADPPAIFCPISGDSRVNENPTLAALHVIFHREHNRLAEGLAAQNPTWNDEQLYQTARKINIAQWEHIVYNEYLPATVGLEIMQENGIDVQPSGYKDTYDPNVDATVFNAFSTAAFRFGHSLIPQVLSMIGFDFRQKRVPEQLHNHFFKTDLYHTYDKLGLEYLLMGMANSPSPLLDRKFEDSVRQNLFFDKNDVPSAFDLVSLNVQRGRDHGLPGYNEYREVCGLSRASDFSASTGGLVDHIPEVAALLQQAYDCPDDIDLYTGLVSEKPSMGSQVGPTAQCLLVRQFKSLRDGDRFFYERRDTEMPEIGFTEDQLEEIKKIRMSTLFCLNTNAEQIQGNMFLRIARADGKPGSCYRKYMSKLENCSGKSGVDLSFWKDIV